MLFGKTKKVLVKQKRNTQFNIAKNRQRFCIPENFKWSRPFFARLLGRSIAISFH